MYSLYGWLKVSDAHSAAILLIYSGFGGALHYTRLHRPVCTLAEQMLVILTARRRITNPVKMTVHNNAPVSHSLGLVLLQRLSAVCNRQHAALSMKDSSFVKDEGSGHKKYSFKMSLAISRIFNIYT